MIKSLSSDYTKTITIFRTIIAINDGNKDHIFDNKWNRIDLPCTDLWKYYYNNKIYHEFKSTKEIRDIRSVAIPYLIYYSILDVFIIFGNQSIRTSWYPDMTIQNIKPDQISREIQGVYERPGMINFWIGDCWFVYQ